MQANDLLFRLVANDNVDTKSTWCTLHLNMRSTCATCFEMCGLICPHIIRVMMHLNVQMIHVPYIPERWSLQATTHTPDLGNGHRAMHFGMPVTKTLKYNSLCRKSGTLSSDACFNDEAYRDVSSLVEQGNVGVVAMKERARNGVAKNEEVHDPEANEHPRAPNANADQ